MKSMRRVYGLHAAETAIERGAATISAAWIDVRRGDVRLARLTARLSACGIRLESVPKRRLDELSRGGNHQGIVLEMQLPAEQGEDDLIETLAHTGTMPLLLVLDQVQDPHNLGACLRTADAVGTLGVVIPKDQAVGLTPTVAKVASGAAETVPIYRVTNLARCLDRLKAAGVWLVGADGEADKTLYDADLGIPLGLVLGAEGKGLRRLTKDRCDLLVRIPMSGAVESLNVSVAAGVLLYEALRQRSGCNHKR